MIIQKVNLINLRNHTDSQISANPDLNILYGKNGSGKTTILEAISIGSLTKTFTSASDSSLVQSGENFYLVRLDSLSHLNLHYQVEISYTTGQRKKINTTYGENQTPKEVVGNIPLVYLSPDLKNITIGSPENRRDFIDKILSQASKSYLDDLMQFKKALKQRNSLLNSFKKNNFFDKAIFESWNQIFIKLASKIIKKRYDFISDFEPVFIKVYGEITNNSEEVNFLYEPNSIKIENENIFQDINFIIEHLENRSKYLLNAEISRGLTLFGPQKDEIKILLNGGIARERASQGQHKSLLISLKFAEFEYLYSIKNETPIILLDDIFSELDDFRSSLVLDRVIERKAQTFVTLTNPDLIRNDKIEKNKLSFFKINDGNVINS